MRISREEALASCGAAKKLLNVRKGQAWLICPYKPHVTYHAVHWDHEQKASVQCEGKKCTYCPRKANPKIHVPALVLKKPFHASMAEGYRFPEGEYFQELRWGTKIVELTQSCFDVFDQESQPDELLLAWRPGERQNGRLFCRWLKTCLKGVPSHLADLKVTDILPGVIGGTYRDAVEEVALDNSEHSRIKHNQTYQTQLAPDASTEVIAGHICMQSPASPIGNFREQVLQEDHQCEGI